MFFYSAFLLGLFGSTHCIAMCGPLVVAIPVNNQAKIPLLWTALIYQFGRIASYVLLGIILGTLGWGSKVAGVQNFLSIAIGIILISTVFFTYSFNSMNFTFLNNSILWVQNWVSKYFTIDSQFAAIRLGILNGLFPCGLVYIALAGAFVHFDTIQGAAYMLLFGLGTLPIMFFTMFLGQKSGERIRKLYRLVPYLLFLFGLLLIVRGLSMEFPENPFLGNFKMCH